MMVTANILDEIHDTLTPAIWEKAGDPEPVLKAEMAHFIKGCIYPVLEKHGYSQPHEWLNLCLTGSLTTYQYSKESDCDISLFVNAAKLPEWSRAELIGLMVENVDGTMLPGTTFPLQDFVVGGGLKPADLYRLGLRSGYDIDAMRWIVPPDRSHTMDVQIQENGFYVYAMEVADKMERLLRYEPNKAVQFWHAIHRRRQEDQKKGRGDFTESNITYKFLAQRGLFPIIAELTGEHVSGEHIASASKYYRTLPTSIRDQVAQEGMQPNPATGNPMHFWDNLENAQRYHGVANELEPHDLWEADDVGAVAPDPWFTQTIHDWGDHPGAWRSDAPSIPSERIRRVADVMAPVPGQETQLEPIRASEISSPTAIERGHSRPVTAEQWQEIAAEGRAKYDAMTTNADGTQGIDANWPALKEHAWQSVQQPWGGATINAATGVPLKGDDDLYALTAKPPGRDTVSIPINASQHHFNAAMDEARSRFGNVLQRSNHHLGVFRDEDVKRLDIDPVLVVDNLRDAENIGAHTRAVGGAYHFKSGDGYWPPHVPEHLGATGYEDPGKMSFAQFRSLNRTDPVAPVWLPQAPVLSSTE